MYASKPKSGLEDKLNSKDSYKERKAFHNRYKKTPLMRLTSDARRPERAAIKLPRKVVPSIIRNLAVHQCRCLDATAEPRLRVLPIEIYIRGKRKSSN